MAPGILPVATSFLKKSVTRASLSLLKCAPGGMSKLPSDEKSSAAAGHMADNVSSAPNDNAPRKFLPNINPLPGPIERSVAEGSIRARPLKARHRLLMKAGTVGRETAED